MSKTYKEWLEYYSNATKEQVIEDLTQDNLEIKRLNNIINELEKHLEKEISRGRSEDNVWLMGCYDEDREILDKLQELKGDSSNDKSNN